MDNAFFTTTNDFSFSTEADYDCFYENETSLYSNDIATQDGDIGNTDNKAMFIMIYGLGGLLVFSFLYSICTAFYFHIKEYLEYDREERQALAEFQERQRPRRILWPSNASSPPSTPTVFERGYISEEMRDMLQRNTRPKQVCQNRERIGMRSISHASPVAEGGRYMSEEFRDMLQRDTSPKQAYQNHEQIELESMSLDSTVFEGGYMSEEFRDMLQRSTRPKQLYQNYEQASFTSQQLSTSPDRERRFYPEDFVDILQPNTAQKQVHRSLEQIELRPISSASSTPPITERTFFYEDFPDMFRPNTLPRQVDQSCEVNEVRPWTYNPPNPLETQRRFFPEDFLDMLQPNNVPEEMCKCKKQIVPRQSHIEINMAPATPERVDTELSPLAERKSKSSPCSPNIVRRRLHAFGGSPRRPSSWRT